MKTRSVWTLFGIMFVTTVLFPLISPGVISAKTIKIGAVLDYSFPLHVSYKKELDAVVEDFNDKGGLKIQGEQYDIEVIVYDSKLNAETARSAVERLIYRDKVKFIMGDETADAWIPLTEANKILVTCASPSPKSRSPEHKYVFQSASFNTQSPIAWAWLSEAHPEWSRVGAVFTDDMKGHAEGKNLERLCKVFGQELVDIIYYPPDTTDFSAIATRLKNMNPHVFTTCAGGPVQDALATKSMREAGWNGQIFSYVGLSPESIKKIISVDYVDGMLGTMSCMDIPQLPPLSQHLKDIYVAKHKKWDNAPVIHINNWYLLISALEQAQSLDADKLADHIAKGMKFESPYALGTTVCRPDLNNPRCVDTLFEVNIGRIVNGQTEIVEKIDYDRAFKYLQVFFAGEK